MRKYEVTAFTPTSVNVFCVVARDYEQAENIADSIEPGAVDFEIREVR